MVAFVDNDQTNALEGILGELLHGECLEHGNHDIAILDVDDVTLDATNPSPRQESTNAILPLVPEEGVMNEDESWKAELRSDVQAAYGFASACSQRENTIAGRGLKVGIDHILLLRPEPPLELPELGGGLGNVAGTGGRRTVGLDPVGFGELEVLLRLEIHGLTGDAMLGYEYRGNLGLDGELLAELGNIGVGFGQSIAMESESHTLFISVRWISIFSE
jgi:hypothetical protein